MKADAPRNLYEEFVEEVQVMKRRTNLDETLSHDQKRTLQICKRCQSTNDMFAHYCNRCGFPLSDQAVNDAMVKEVENRLKDETFANLILQSPIIREALKETLVETINQKLTESPNPQN